MAEEKKLKSDLVLKCWIKHWKACERKLSHKNWTREALITFISAESDIKEEDVKSRISQNFRYATRQLLEAYVEADMRNNNNDIHVATAWVVGDMRKKLGLPSFDFTVEEKANGRGVKCVKVVNWKLPDSSASKGRDGIDWVGEFDDLF